MSDSSFLSISYSINILSINCGCRLQILLVYERLKRKNMYKCIILDIEKLC